MADNSAGERTEKPTGKKLKDAKERGQVARSQSLTGAVTLATVALVLSWFGAQMVTTIAARLASNSHGTPPNSTSLMPAWLRPRVCTGSLRITAGCRRSTSTRPTP